MSRRKFFLPAVAALAISAFAVAPAAATHTHAMLVGNGLCVVIAEDAGEENVVLPGSVFANNPNVDIAPAVTREHPLHVLVHQGTPGEQNSIQVYGTPAADAMCFNGYVNR
jgi:hydrogenase maturation factor HypF (carbamoyltransferase family)